LEGRNDVVGRRRDTGRGRKKGKVGILRDALVKKNGKQEDFLEAEEEAGAESTEGRVVSRSKDA
jgi:hypothetical protein